LGKYVRFSDADLAAIVANAVAPINSAIVDNFDNASRDEHNQTHPEGTNDTSGAR
jgi:hypothetical protein